MAAIVVLNPNCMRQTALGDCKGHLLLQRIPQLLNGFSRPYMESAFGWDFVLCFVVKRARDEHHKMRCAAAATANRMTAVKAITQRLCAEFAESVPAIVGATAELEESLRGEYDAMEADLRDIELDRVRQLFNEVVGPSRSV